MMPFVEQYGSVFGIGEAAAPYPLFHNHSRACTMSTTLTGSGFLALCYDFLATQRTTLFSRTAVHATARQKKMESASS